MGDRVARKVEALAPPRTKPRTVRVPRVAPVYPPLHSLRHWREQKRLTQRDLADQAGVSIALISRMETGSLRARPAMIDVLAEILDVESLLLCG